MVSFKTAALYLGGVSSFLSATSATSIYPLLSSLSSGAQVFYPNAANWTDTIQRWTEYEGPSFFASIKPATVKDVQKIVNYASANNISFLAQGGGHGYSVTFGALQNGLAIDLSSFNNVSVNAAENTMTIGGGVRFRDVFEPLYAAGKEIQTGSGSCVGMVGATLGAGVGRYQGLHGLIIDALKEVKMVTADGSYITVSETREPELFWGMRGAGFNYGIVLEATYEVHDLTNQGSVLNADFLFDPSVNETYFELLASFNNTLSAPLSLFTLVYNDTQYGPAIILNAAYAGPEDEGLEILKPFMDLPYLKRNITQLTWDVLDSSALFGLDADFCINGGLHDLWALGIKTFDVPTHVDFFTKMVNFMNENPGAAGTSYEIEFFSAKAVQAVPDSATAYPHRDITAHVMLTFGFEDMSLADTVNEFASSSINAFQSTSGFDDLQVYVSYAHGTESLEARYGKHKLPQLLQLKQKWDPKNVFKYDNGLLS